MGSVARLRHGRRCARRLRRLPAGVRRAAPIIGDTFPPADAQWTSTRRILAGPAIFGIGWGLGGFCPGPALTALGLGEPGTLAFVPAMFFGMWAAQHCRATILPIAAGRLTEPVRPMTTTRRAATYLPILDWGRRYDRRTLTSDLVAAMIVTIMLIPQSLAYAMLAGLPAEVGLYASILPLVAYALFGTSRTLAVGPVAVVSLMTASADRRDRGAGHCRPISLRPCCWR